MDCRGPRGRLAWRVVLALSVLPVLQLGGCALFDGGLAERTLSGTVFDPIALQVFEAFFALGSGGI